MFALSHLGHGSILSGFLRVVGLSAADVLVVVSSLCWSVLVLELNGDKISDAAFGGSLRWDNV